MSRLGLTVMRMVGALTLVMGTAACAAPAAVPTAPSSTFAEFTGDPRVALRAAQQRWAAHGPRNYDYTVTIGCFCLFIQRTVRFEVRDGVSRALDANAATIDRFHPRSRIDLAFEEIWRLLELGPHRFSAEYDPQLGYPTLYVVDPRAWTADDEFGVFIQAFVPR